VSAAPPRGLPMRVAPRTSERRLALGMGVALSLHAGVWLGLRGLPVRLERALLVVTEVDLTPAAPAAVAPQPAPPPPAPVAPAEPARAVARRPAKAPDAPAAAAPLHTASEATPSAGEPLRFAVDARGTGYGFGVVAQGGATRAGSGAQGAVPASAAPARDLRAFASPPRLEESDPCRGHFPQAASADRGEVTLELSVSAEGAVREARILHELPGQQGFGRAALTCLRAKRFLPARDAAGREIPSLAPVSVRFAR
jgi:TonB family protein